MSQKAGNVKRNLGSCYLKMYFFSKIASKQFERATDKGSAFTIFS